MSRMSFLPEKFSGTEERPRGLFPADHGTPLVIILRQIPIGMDLICIKITEQRLGSGAHAHALLQRLQPSVGYPRNLRRKAFHMILLLLEQALRDEHGQIHILHACLLEPPVQLLLDIFPDRITGRFNDHAAFYACVINQFRFLHHVRIPLGEIRIHGGDALHQLLVFCHIRQFSFYKSYAVLYWFSL